MDVRGVSKAGRVPRFQPGPAYIEKVPSRFPSLLLPFLFRYSSLLFLAPHGYSSLPSRARPEIQPDTKKGRAKRNKKRKKRKEQGLTKETSIIMPANHMVPELCPLSSLQILNLPTVVSCTVTRLHAQANHRPSSKKMTISKPRLKIMNLRQRLLNQ